MTRFFRGILTGSAALVLAGAVQLSAGAEERVTFTKDILPILQENCQTCHRPSGTNLSGMIAPMSLMTYEEVRPWAKAISKAASEKVMPPWHAAEEFHGVFSNERTLRQEQIDTLVAWAGQRAPRGNPKDAPEPLSFSESGWNFGEPDLIVDFPEPFFVPDDIQDLYHNVNTKLSEAQLPEDRWIRSIEFKPGSEVVHHIIGHASAPGAAGGPGRGMLGGNAPGADQAEWPEGYGILLKKGSTVTFALHYHKEAGPGTGRFDSSQIGLQFHPIDKPVTHPIEISTVSHGGFEIPPGHPFWKVGASRTFDEDTLLLNMLPHMHLRGTAARYTAFYPDGTSEVLLHVPEYDFNWQTGYGLKEEKLLPAGTRIEMEMWFDNSSDRAEYTGINPERAISFGGPTTDEMDLAWITVTPKKAIGTSGDD